MEAFLNTNSYTEDRSKYVLLELRMLAIIQTVPHFTKFLVFVDQSKEDCKLNESKSNTFVKPTAMNNSHNNSDCIKLMKSAGLRARH